MNPLAAELNQALEDMDHEEDIRVILLKGNGRVFCAGIDVSVLPMQGVRDLRTWIKSMHKVHTTITRLVKPVIVAAHGVAAANGAGLVASADLAVVAEGTRIGTTAINLGLFCMGPAVPLSRCVGKKHALDCLIYITFLLTYVI